MKIEKQKKKKNNYKRKRSYFWLLERERKKLIETTFFFYIAPVEISTLKFYVERRIRYPRSSSSIKTISRNDKTFFQNLIEHRRTLRNNPFKEFEPLPLRNPSA